MKMIKSVRSKTLRSQQRPENRDVFWMPVNSQIIGWSWIQSWGDKGAFGRDMYILRGVSGVKLRNVPKQATCFMDMDQSPSSQ